MALTLSLRLWLRQLFQSLADLASETLETILDTLLADTIVFYKDAADAAANTNTTDTYFYRAEYAEEVTAVNLITAGTLTANDSNYATITIEKSDGAAGTQTTVASQTTKITGGSGDWAAGTEEALTLSTTKANVQLDAGDWLNFKIDKSGTGVAVPISTIAVHTKKL